MKKFKKWPVIAVALLVVGIILLADLSRVASGLSEYHQVVKLNWEIDLPGGYEELYAYSEPSFHGDGLRYHVLDYPAGAEDKKNLERIWRIEQLFRDAELPSEWEIERINGWLDEMGVPGEFAPDYGRCELLYARKEDHSELYLLWQAGDGTLYVVESFL